MRSTRKAKLIGRDIGPRVPFRYPADMWDYEPQGPWFRFELHGTRLGIGPQQFEVWDSFEATVDRLAEHASPPWYHTICFVLDDQGVVVLGYLNGDEHREVHGPYGWWIGVRAGFEMLERFHDPEEVAIWETMAKETVW